MLYDEAQRRLQAITENEDYDLEVRLLANVVLGTISHLSQVQRSSDVEARNDLLKKWIADVDSLFANTSKVSQEAQAHEATRLLEESLGSPFELADILDWQTMLLREFGSQLPASMLASLLHGPSHHLANGAGYLLPQRGPQVLRSIIPDLICVLCNPRAVGHSTAIKLLRDASPEAIEPLSTAVGRGIVGMGGVYARALLGQLREALKRPAPPRFFSETCQETFLPVARLLKHVWATAPA